MPDLLDLPPHRPMPPGRADARRLRLEEYVSRRRRPWPGRWAARPLVVGAAASSLLFAGGAAAYVASRPATVPVEDQTRCYTRATLAGGDKDFYGTTVSQAWASDGSRTAVDAVEACSAVWRQGLLRLGSKEVGGPDTGRFDHPVPPLVACVLHDGVAAVFPGDTQTCRRLGLPRLAE